jgi:hypothetical protein
MKKRFIIKGKNSKGASAIMFSLFFIMVISLLTIGFATIARRDQRATLDKTLSAQAQLAAETGVNSVTQYIYSTATPQPNAECNPPGTLTGYSKPVMADGVELSCITWQTQPFEAGFTLEPFESYSFNQKNHTGHTKLQWSTVGAANDKFYTYSGSNELPSIQSGYKSIIKVVTVTKADLYQTGTKEAQVFYLVPYNGASIIPAKVTDPSPNVNAVDLGNVSQGNLDTAIADGLVYYVPCGNADSTCTVDIEGYSFSGDGNASYGDRLFYFMPMGTQKTSLVYQSLSGRNGAPTALDGIQIKIDVNAKAQDQSKRLISYIPAEPLTNTWQPFFAAAAESLCKDVKIDGTNASGLQGAVCPAVP